LAGAPAGAGVGRDAGAERCADGEEVEGTAAGRDEAGELGPANRGGAGAAPDEAREPLAGEGAGVDADDPAALRT
jgi:hypothetical protein